MREELRKRKLFMMDPRNSRPFPTHQVFIVLNKAPPNPNPSSKKIVCGRSVTDVWWKIPVPSTCEPDTHEERKNNYILLQERRGHGRIRRDFRTRRRLKSQHQRWRRGRKKILVCDCPVAAKKSTLDLYERRNVLIKWVESKHIKVMVISWTSTPLFFGFWRSIRS